jgi:general secretion pathway protein E
VIEEKGLTRFLDNGRLTLYHAKGCKECGDIGYNGRMAIIEFLVMTDAIRKMVMEHKESGLIQERAVKDGMFTLYHDGLAKAAKGLTTLDEVLRITTEG